MAVFSTSPNIVSCSGNTLETIQSVDDSPINEHGLQRPLRFADFSIAKLMHKESYSVFGRIDFHSVLQYLIVFLGGCLDQDWTLLTPVLAKVDCFDCFQCSVLCCGLTIWFLQAVRTCQIELCTLPTLCQELLSHWSNVSNYLDAYAPPHEMMGVRKQVSFAVILTLGLTWILYVTRRNFSHKIWREQCSVTNYSSVDSSSFTD